MVSSTVLAINPPVPRPFTPSAPFDLPSSALSSRSNSWFMRDELVRRFVEPATNTEKETTDKNIKSAVDAYHDALGYLGQILKSDDLDSILSPSSTIKGLHEIAIGIQKGHPEGSK